MSTANVTQTGQVASVTVVVSRGLPGTDGVGVPIGGTSGQVLAKASETDYDTEWVAPTAGSGTGDVTGPASATDNAITRFNGTTGKAIQNSGATIDDSGNITANNLSGTNTGDQDLTGYLQNIAEDTTPELAADLDAGGNNVTNIGDITFKTGAAGGTLRTGTSAADKFQLQAYDNNDGIYRTLIEADAGNTPTLQLFADFLHLEDATDSTKIADFNLSGATTSTTTALNFTQTANRTITFPDATGTLQVQPAEGPFIDGDKTKLDLVSITQPVNLDQVESDVASIVGANVFTPGSGWATYEDGTYTAGSPFAVSANTDTQLPNDAANSIETYLPVDVAEMYNSTGQVITGRNGDGLLITVEFDAVTSSATGSYIELWFDIGGVVGELYRGVMTTFPKGNSVAVGCIRTLGTYTLDTWEANGAQVWVRANAAVDIYNIRYILTRTSKARASGSLDADDVDDSATINKFVDATEKSLIATATQPGDDAATLGSGAASDGFVLTADGLGGSAFEAPVTGVTDHGALTGLADDDHTQYHTDARALTWLGTRSTADLADSTDKRYVTDADATKLDGIEALADVTDTANVTAAGALMDSEVTNLAAVKAFDPTLYPLKTDPFWVEVVLTGAGADIAAGAKVAMLTHSAAGTITGFKIVCDPANEPSAAAVQVDINSVNLTTGAVTSRLSAVASIATGANVSTGGTISGTQTVAFGDQSSFDIDQGSDGKELRALVQITPS